MPSQMADQADLLRSLGLEIEPEALSDPLGTPLSAIVSLGGCSASFVSPEGLIITNHHCVKNALDYHSSGEDNLVEKGFLAADRSQEKWNGPTSRVYVSQRFTDVTARMLDGLEDIADPRLRYEAIETRYKELLAECEKDRPDIRCSVSGYFLGATYYLIEQLQIRDIRLVYAPHQGIGYFGGDEDNWMWPRHTGDYAFYRAYVGKDGKPADYSPDNVPFQPRHHLPIARQPLRAGDFVMVAGFPGFTSRHRTANEVAEAVEWSYPRRIAAYREYIATLEATKSVSKDTAIKAETRIMGYQNGLKKGTGVMEGMRKGGLLERKRQLEKELVAWIDADVDRRSRYGTVLIDMQRLDQEKRTTRDRDAAIGALYSVSMLNVARSFVRMAEERPKPDAERDPQLQERNWPRRIARQKSFLRRYDQAIDRALFKLVLRRAARKPEINREWLVLVLGEQARTGAIGDDLIERVVDQMYQSSKLEALELRLRLFQEGSTESLSAMDDPFIQLALRLRPMIKAEEERSKKRAGAMTLLRPQYIRALREFRSGAMAPDANGTLRITFGTVRGYRPTKNAEMYQPFTTLAQMVAKHRGTHPFDVPKKALEAAGAPGVAGYRDQVLGDVPVNFLSDLDITGGNSGSATLNARGELVGVAFDSTLEAVASDWLFTSEYNRTIHVDIRYVLWIMDQVDEAHHLLKEMGVAPRTAAEVASKPATTPSRP